MTSMKLRVLILDDEPKIAAQLSWHLKKKGLEVSVFNLPEQAFRYLKDNETDVMLLDVMMPGINGLEVLERVSQLVPDTSVIMMSGYGDMEMVISAMRLGAVDFIRKPFQVMDIMLALERTGKLRHLKSQLTEMQEKHSLLSNELEQQLDREFVGRSEIIRQTMKMALKVASDPEVNVLITGENGTGKEIIARLIHFASPRKERMFVPVNSAAIPEQLLESQFFGHVKGAFTDAKEERKGFLEMASGGTLFLDEIGDMSLALQAKLLRALEEKKIRRVGGDKEIVVDVRIISATNKSPFEMVNEGTFRIDLYHRINTIELPLPPLRERISDIEPLTVHFVEQIATRKNQVIPEISSSVYEKLKGYSFPGNVRELRNLVERAMILSEGNRLDPEDFLLKDNCVCTPSLSSALNLEQLEISTIIDALEQSSYIQKEAAFMLGISRDALKRKIKKYNISIQRFIS